MKRREIKFVPGSMRLVPEGIGAASPALTRAAAARKGLKAPKRNPPVLRGASPRKRR
jgi:hypothetical protein